MAQAPVLTWRNSKGNVISVAVTGKHVWLDGQPLDQAMPFTIRKKGFLSRLPGIGRLDRPTVTRINTAHAKGVVRSASAWEAGGDQTDPTKRCVYFFEDDKQNHSGDLTVTSLASAEFRTIRYTKDHEGIGAAVPMPWGTPLGVDLGRSGGGTLELAGTIAVPRDPPLNLDILSPWGRGDESLQTFIQAYRSYHAVDPLFPMSLDDSIEPWIQPTGEGSVEISLSNPRVDVSPEEPAQFSVSIRFKDAVQFAFAIRARHAEDREQYVLSELFPVQAITA
jgi:hypothetical protein